MYSNLMHFTDNVNNEPDTERRLGKSLLCHWNCLICVLLPMNYVELCIVKLLLGVLYTPTTRHVQYYSPFYVKANLQLKRVADINVIDLRILETPRIRFVYQLNKALGGPQRRYGRFRRKGGSPGGNRNIFVLQKYPDWPWDPYKFLSEGYRCSSVGAKRPGRFHHSPPSSGEVKNECSYVHLHLPRRRHGKFHLITFIPDDDPKVFETCRVSKIFIQVICDWLERPLMQSVDMNTLKVVVTFRPGGSEAHWVTRQHIFSWHIGWSAQNIYHLNSRVPHSCLTALHIPINHSAI